MQNKDYWYPWFPVKFRRKTIGLTRIERHAYRDLIDWYMETGEPLPNSPVALASITCMDVDGWSMAAASILPFFTVGEDGLLHNETCDEILLDQTKRSKSFAERGKKGAEKKWQNQQANGNSQTVAMARPMANPSTGHDRTGQSSPIGEDNREVERPAKTKAVILTPEEVTLPPWLSVDIWKTFLDHRCSLKKPMTAHAQQLALRELATIRGRGFDPVEVINRSIVNGWQGLFEPKGRDASGRRPTASDEIKQGMAIAIRNLNQRPSDEIF